MHVLKSLFLSLLFVNSIALAESGSFITPEVWINAEINTVEKGIIDAVWRKGGESTTERGDKVIWGYFYANPNDVTWGSEDNPDLFVKAWFDVSGRIDVNYFHVSVPDIHVSSIKDAGEILYATATLDQRYVRHSFYVDGTQESITESTGDEVLRGAYTYQDESLPFPTGVADIYTEEKGKIAAEGEVGGSGTSERGDVVMWGYYYANSDDVSWGDANNPEAFFKIWLDSATARYDANYFHVSVPDIEINTMMTYIEDADFSSVDDDDVDFDIDWDSLLTSVTTLQSRYVRHEYELELK